MSAHTFEPVIGLEVHVQLATATKLFCADAAAFGGESNTRVCPVCLGLPGALPVLNGQAVDLAVRAALGLDCTVHERSVFARKNYFYPDLPKGYQITQFDRPIATGGGLEADRRVRIRRLHLEEDAGKSLHERFARATAIDLNRAGVPLIEIVTEPDLGSPGEARAFLGRLKQVLEYLDVSDCDMEKGSLRVDANVSVRRRGSERLGTKTEVKNMNSFSNVERALSYEIARQIELLSAGESVMPETLLWDPGHGEARPMRGKEESEDYRYLPDPDLPPLVLDMDRVEQIRAALPELPGAREARLRTEHGLPGYDAGVLAAARPVADYYEATVTAGAEPKAASNWVMTEVLGWTNRTGTPVHELAVAPSSLAELIGLVADGTVSMLVAKGVFLRMAETGRDARSIVAEEGLAQVREASRIEAWVDEVLAAHPSEVERYRGGEGKVLAFLMGQVMKRSGGKADPREANRLLTQRLRA